MFLYKEEYSGEEGRTSLVLLSSLYSIELDKYII